MGAVNFGGFEIGSTSVLDAAATSGTFTVVTTPVKHGTYAFETNPTTTAVGFARFRGFGTNGGSAFVSLSTLYAGFYFRVATLPSANSEEMFSVRSSTALKMALRINSAGSLMVFDSTGIVQIGSDSGTALSLNTWYWITVSCATGLTAAVEVLINGVSEISGTGNLTVDNGAAIDLGKTTNRNGETVDFFYDDWQLDDAALPTEKTSLLLQPDSDGSAVTWTRGGTDSGNDWDQVNEIPPDTADYLVSTLGIADRSHVGFESCASAGVSGTITAVRFSAYSARDGAANGTYSLGIRSGGTNSDNAATNIAGAGFAWVIRASVSTVLVVDPTDAAAWTVAKVDALEGCVIEQEATDKTKTAWMGLEVLFTPVMGPLIGPGRLMGGQLNAGRLVRSAA